MRAEELDLQDQLAQLTSQFGPQYPKVQEVTSRLQQVRGAIATEIKNSGSRAESEYQAALQRERMLRGQLEGQKQEANQLNQSAIEYNLLKREADSNRQLYDGLLQKLKEAGVSAGLKSSNIRQVDLARVPLAPSQPNIPRNLAIALLMGLTGGVTFAFLKTGPRNKLPGNFLFQNLINRRLKNGGTPSRPWLTPLTKPPTRRRPPITTQSCARQDV